MPNPLIHLRLTPQLLAEIDDQPECRQLAYKRATTIRALLAEALHARALARADQAGQPR